MLLPSSGISSSSGSPNSLISSSAEVTKWDTDGILDKLVLIASRYLTGSEASKTPSVEPFLAPMGSNDQHPTPKAVSSIPPSG